mmetsp:Transcript_35339/g.60020  ORF Transcript_35339/g.60020 Transcript_35339/m.60020 type:complete len:234 (-) Transcript_35339:377-1078(-)
MSPLTTTPNDLPIDQSPSPKLPNHIHQIMDAFLWNNKNTAPMHEQRKHEETQSRILSRLRRLVARRPASQSRDDMQLLAPKDPPQLIRRNASKENVPNLNNRTWVSITDREPKINHRGGHSHQHEMQQQHPPPTYKPLNIRTNDEEARWKIRIDDEEDDIECCDGRCCHEGAKNLCTISIWALIVFALVNRFFVHMATHANKNESVTLKVEQINVVPITDGEVEPQTFETDWR